MSELPSGQTTGTQKHTAEEETSAQLDEGEEERCTNTQYTLSELEIPREGNGKDKLYNKMSKTIISNFPPPPTRQILCFICQTKTTEIKGQK